MFIHEKKKSAKFFLKKKSNIIALRVIINRKSKIHSLGIKWKREYFRHDVGMPMPFSYSAEDVTTYYNTCEEMFSLMNDVKPLLQKTSSIESFNKSFDILIGKDIRLQSYGQEYIKFKNCSDSSKASYSMWLKMVCRYGNPPVTDINLSWVKAFDDSMKQMGRKQNTMATLHTILSMVLKNAVKDGLLSENPYNNFKVIKEPTAKKALSPEQVNSLWNLYNQKTLTPIRQEGLRLFLFAYCTGMRSGDIVSFDEKCHIKNDYISKPIQKSGGLKHHSVPISSSARTLINQQNASLKMTDKRLQNALRAVSKVIGFKITMHMARHTLATEVAADTNDPYLVQRLLGHSSLDTSLYYVKVSSDKMKRSIEKVTSLQAS